MDNRVCKTGGPHASLPNRECPQITQYRKNKVRYLWTFADEAIKFYNALYLKKSSEN
jgi:hypothetical protein